MSSMRRPVIRNCSGIALPLALLGTQPLLAQEETERADGTIEIDILARPAGEGPVDPRLVEECVRQEDASQISGEIVVCRQFRERTDNSYYGDREAAQDNYAAETAYRDAPATPNVDGPGIFQGEPTIGGLCIPGLQKCPPPPALIVDVAALPKAPPGSDADRIARGLPPIGNDGESEDGDAISEDELGLPPLPDPRRSETPVD